MTPNTRTTLVTAAGAALLATGLAILNTTDRSNPENMEAQPSLASQKPASPVARIQNNATAVGDQTTSKVSQLVTYKQPGQSAAALAAGLPAATPVAVDLASMPASTNWQQFNPEKINVTIAGVPMTFARQKVENWAGGHTVWTGYSQEAASADWRLVSSGTPDCYDAWVVGVDGNDYHLSFRNGSFVVEEKNRADFICGNEDEMTPPAAIPTSAAVSAAGPRSAATTANSNGTVVAALVKAPTTVATVAPPAVVVAADQQVNISRVMFVFSETDLTSPHAPQFVQTEAQAYNNAVAALATANTYVTASGITNFQWQAVGHMVMPAYTETSSTQNDLNQVAANATVAATRDLLMADQVVLEVNAAGSGVIRDVTGRAFQPASPLKSQAFTVLVGIDPTGLAHEMGHNFGLHHDRTQAAYDGEAAANGMATNPGYYYGYTFTDTTWTATGQWGYQGHVYPNNYTGDIMAYAATTVGMYSSPNLTYHGFVFGVAAGQPNAADNARWISEHAAAMASIYPTPTAPLITVQPTGKSLHVGDTLMMSVTATGGGLTYQWSKDGTVIAGATGPIYSKNNVQLTDAGSYTVAIHNILGDATSNAAAVTVTLAPTPTPTPIPTPTPNNQGGGGGGAFGFPFLVLLGLLAGLRSFLRR